MLSKADGVYLMSGYFKIDKLDVVYLFVIIFAKKKYEFKFHLTLQLFLNSAANAAIIIYQIIPEKPKTEIFI